MLSVRGIGTGNECLVPYETKRMERGQAGPGKKEPRVRRCMHRGLP